MFDHKECDTTDFVLNVGNGKTKKQHVDMISVVPWGNYLDPRLKRRKGRIRNEDIRNKPGLAPVEDKMRENHLRWFGHLYRRSGQTVVRRSDDTRTTTKRKRGRPKENLVLDD